MVNIDSDNGSPSVRLQRIVWTIADPLSSGPSKIQMLSAKWQPFCSGPKWLKRNDRSPLPDQCVDVQDNMFIADLGYMTGERLVAAIISGGVPVIQSDSSAIVWSSPHVIKALV